MTDTNELRKLLAAAMPVPWTVSHGEDSWEVVGTKPDAMPYFWARRTAFDDGSAGGEYGASCTVATRDLIVAAVNALPALLDELDDARADLREAIVEVARFRAEVERLRADLREAMELLRAHGQPPDWIGLGDADWNRRYGALLAKHKETP
jgi:hypothetical protein